MILSILGALGGVAVFGTAIYAVIKAAIKQSETTERLAKVVDKLDSKVDNHETRISVLEDRKLR